ncbi:dihydroneopterin aldolase [Cognatishimia sp. MH4019]|uniref:dihydroneopterin aldolase n=1 Tax=Cognatishimia sp. MH4019 TaxID=2854030 RepID=UPI001CD1E887|nr:dihydroneopterin aldolase [Cognatishimia sp. MH4019]
MQSTVELRDLVIACDIGTYGPGDVVPDAHVLDLTLKIDPELVFIDADGMDRVFDYDPLVVEIDRLARDGHYHTQERLMTRIVEACAGYAEIEAVDIALRKSPVLAGAGSLGVRLVVPADQLAAVRSRLARSTG